MPSDLMTTPSAQPWPVLPAELQEIMLDFLHDSPKDLKICALVCWRWLFRSRSHLRIVIREDQEDQISNCALTDFQSLLDHSLSTLPLSARHLHIYSSKSTESHQVLAVLNRLRSLSSLTLALANWDFTSWQKATAKFSDFTTITELVVRNRSCILHRDIVPSFPSLRKLEIIGCNWKLAYKPTHDHTTASMRNLSTLVIQQCDLTHLPEWFFSLEIMPQIRTLRLKSVYSSNLATANKMLEVLGPRLRELELDFSSG
jgi:hypothetical protein